MPLERQTGRPGEPREPGRSTGPARRAKSADPVPISRYVPSGADSSAVEKRGLSRMALGIVGSEILKIASDIRALKASGHSICNLTVGDFSPQEFRIPELLQRGITEALAAGHTNYPPSDGIESLRRAVVSFYERRLGLSYPIESVLVAGGARPLIYGTFKTLVDPGETVVYPVPSWNNNHYCYLSSARAVEVPVSREENFLPTAERLAPVIGDARLICINSPLNPTGTVLSRQQVEAIATLVVEENLRRERDGRRALYLAWDQVYWMLTFGDVRHHTPPGLVPESARWTILIDAISKSFAATGLRVGWALAPAYVTNRMRDVLGHVGAWAPRPEQMAAARLLEDDAAIESYHEEMIVEVRRRLDALHEGFSAMAAGGLPVQSVPPQGAIYLSVRFDLNGRTVGGKNIRTNEDIRRLLLESAGFAVVPFQAFGLKEESGWFRLSVGAISPAEIAEGLGRVRRVLEGADDRSA